MKPIYRRLVSGLLLICLCATQALAGPPTAESLSMGFDVEALRNSNRADVEAALSLWTGEITQVISVPAKITFYQSMPDMQKAFRAGKINLVVADGINLLLDFDPGELADGFGGGAPGEDSMVLLVLKTSDIKTDQALLGKRVVLMSDNAISDLVMNTTCLRLFHKSCAQAGLIVSKEESSRLQVLRLFFGKVDAALVRSYAYDLAADLNPQIRQQLKIIARIPVYPAQLGMFSAKVSKPFRDYVTGSLPLMNKYPRAQQVLDMLKTSRLSHYDQSVLDPIRELMREHEALTLKYMKGGTRNDAQQLQSPSRATRKIDRRLPADHSGNTAVPVHGLGPG